MRRPRDFDAELKALDDKAKELKERKLRQLGELVIATGADALPVEELAGALLGAVGARAGGAPVGAATLRVTFWGALAMALTAGIGLLVGTAV